MKLISLNIEANLHYEQVLPFVMQYQPDVICMQEVLEEDFSFLKEKFGLDGVYRPRGYAHSTYPRYDAIRGKRYGTAIFAKNIVKTGHIYYEGQEENLDSYEKFLTDIEGLTSYALIWVDVKAENEKIYRFITTHFPISEKGQSSPHQLNVVEKLLTSLKPLEGFVLCGDFNAPRGNETFSRIANVYEDVIPQEYITSIDQNLHRDKGIVLMVDGLFVTKDYKAENVRLVDGVSDHMAILADIESAK